MLGTKGLGGRDTRARVRQAGGTFFFLPINLMRHRAPARLSARAARCDHPSVRIIAALGACPKDRCRALPGPFPLFLPFQTTLRTNPPGSLPSRCAGRRHVHFGGCFGLLPGRPVAPRHGPAERPRLPDSQGPPLRGEHAVRRVSPVSQLHGPGQDQFRRVLIEAFAPGRLAAYARVVLTDECQARLRMAEG